MKASVKQLIKWFGSCFVYYSGICSLYKLLSSRKEPQICIVLYHCVNDEKNPFFPGVSIKNFERQIKFLKKHFKIISLDELTNILGSDSPSSKKNLLAITFDDGYKDNYTNAFPIMKKYDIPATIFVSPGYVSNYRVMAKDVLNYILCSSRGPKKSFEVRLKNENISVTDRDFLTMEERINLYNRINNMLIQMPLDEQTKALRILSNQLGVSIEDEAFKKYAYDFMLHWEDMKIMTENNITIGAHPLNHLHISACNKDELFNEIKESKSLIEKHIGKPVKYYAYCYGGEKDINEDCLRMTKELKFEQGHTGVFGYNNHNTDPFLLKRIGIGEWSAQAFKGRFSKAVFATELYGMKQILKGLMGYQTGNTLISQ